MTEVIVGTEDELEEGERIIVDIEGQEIGIFKIDGEYYATVNYCIHQGGPLCEGQLTGTTEADFNRETLELEIKYSREGEILNCPWHSWEYDIKTGECLSRQGFNLPTYEVSVEDGNIVVSL